MKKQFAKLSKTEQAKVEAWYHEQNPEGFDDIMSRATTHSPDILRLKERVLKETGAASKSSKKRERNKGSGLKRQAIK